MHEVKQFIFMSFYILKSLYEVHYQLSLSIANIGRCECDNFYFYAVVII